MYSHQLRGRFRTLTCGFISDTGLHDAQHQHRLFTELRRSQEQGLRHDVCEQPGLGLYS